jgi:hypothetical protein
MRRHLKPHGSSGGSGGIKVAVKSKISARTTRLKAESLTTQTTLR